jgi:hypothetical protein
MKMASSHEDGLRRQKRQVMLEGVRSIYPRRKPADPKM